MPSIYIAYRISTPYARLVPLIRFRKILQGRYKFLYMTRTVIFIDECFGHCFDNLNFSENTLITSILNRQSSNFGEPLFLFFRMFSLIFPQIYTAKTIHV